MKGISTFGRAYAVFLAMLSLLFFPLVAGEIAGMFRYPFDPAGAFAWISVHHIVQALFFIVFMVVISTLIPVDWRLKVGDFRRGVRYVNRFTRYFLLYTALGFIYVVASGTFRPFAYPLTATNILGQLGFQLLLSGPSEELLFRSFGIGLVIYFFPQRIFKGRLSIANLLLAVVFALAHVSIWTNPFSITYDPIQLIYAFVLGLIYGDCFEKTGSVWAPMALHSISNFIAVASTIVVTALLR